jgi:protein-S-isoprenylcysteine O-methyltransferase Ste14
LNLGIIIIVVSALWLGTEISLARLKRSGPADRRFDKSSLHILWIAIFISVNGGVLLGMQSVGRIGSGSGIISIAGIILIVVGLVVRWFAIFSLKRQFTVDVAITEDHRIVKEGIYRFVRHPAYGGSLLSFLGLGLCFSNYLCLLTVFVPTCSAFLYRIHIEEKALTEVFGEEYLSYCASTKRLIPGIY